jgi:hypothetical protein
MPGANDIQEKGTALLSQIPLGAIIGSPLKAAVDAQAAAAQACYEFIEKVGFEPVRSADGKQILAQKVRDITFVFERTTRAADAPETVAATDETDANGEKKKPVAKPAANSASKPEAGNGGSVTRIYVTVPLLTIMPLPFIRIESMTVNFKASISAVSSTSQSEASQIEGNAKLGGSFGLGLWKLDVGGSISSKKDSTSTNASKYSVEHTMDISVHAVQDDMPAGLSKLLSYMTESIVANRA